MFVQIAEIVSLNALLLLAMQMLRTPSPLCEPVPVYADTCTS